MAHPDTEIQPNNPENPSAILTEPTIPAWQSALYEERQARIRAESAANDARAEVERSRVAPVAQPALEPGDIVSDPEKFRQRLLADVAAQSAPVNQFIQEFARKDAYNQLKARIKASNPGAAQALAQVEGHIDNAFYSNPQLQANEQTFMMVLQNVVGGLLLSGAFNNNGNNAPPNNPPNRQPSLIPPNIRPSAPPAPSASTVTIDPNSFSENERRLARESKMTLEEFAIMRDCPENEAMDAWKKILAARKKEGR